MRPFHDSWPVFLPNSQSKDKKFSQYIKLSFLIAEFEIDKAICKYF